MQVTPHDVIALRPHMKHTEEVAFSHSTTIDLYVSPTAFRMIWSLIILYHCVNAVFIFGVGAVQVFISDPVVYANVWLIDIPRHTLLLAGWTYLAIASLHLFSVLQHSWQSLHRCRLTFERATNASLDVCTLSSCLPVKVFKTRLISYRCIRSVVQIWDFIRITIEAFSIRGVHFYTGFHIRQFASILMQTFQAYLLSGSVTSPTINRFVVGLIVINCVYELIIDRLFDRNHALQRVARVTIDLLLNFTISVVVPIVICIPHALEFNWSAFTYPEELVFNEVWLSKTITEVRQIFVSSYTDYLTSSLLLVSGVLDLRTLKMILYQTDRVPPLHALVPPITTTNILVSSQPPCTSRIQRLHGGMTTLWAIFVLYTHYISQKPRVPHCSLHVSAWFTTNTSCSIAQINCYRLNTTGSSEDIAHAVAAFERSMLSKLVLSHCSALVVPPIVREFSQLKGFESFNNTIVHWTPSAALTEASNPKIQEIQLLDSTFATFPEALLRPDLPLPANIVIFKSNMTQLPESIGSVWTNRTWPMIRIEYTQLTRLPSSFRHLRVNRLALTNNRLDNLDGNVFTPQRFVDLRLSNNPLRSLPSSMGDTSNLVRLLLENTEVSNAPDWLLKWWKTLPMTGVVSFIGSPFCTIQTVWATAAPCIHSVVPVLKDDFRYDIIASQRPL